MNPLKGYVGPPKKLRAIVGRSKTLNHPDDLALIRKLLNQISHDDGGPRQKLTLFDDVAKNPIFDALTHFQDTHRIVHRRTGNAYGWTGPKGETLAAMNRLATRGTRPARHAGYLNVSQLSYSRVASHFYAGAAFRRRAGDSVFSSRGSLNNATRSVNTCALRVSYALLRAGKRLRVNNGSWKYRNGRTTAWLTSTAERLANELAKGEFVVTKRSIENRKGVIAFLGGYKAATGHITLWNGKRAALGRNEEQWEFPTIYFFPLKG